MGKYLSFLNSTQIDELLRSRVIGQASTVSTKGDRTSTADACSVCCAHMQLLQNVSLESKNDDG